MFDTDQVALSVAWALKESALRATRAGHAGLTLQEARIQNDFSVDVDDVHMHAMAIRVLDGAVVAVVGRPLLHEQAVTRISLPGVPAVEESVSRIAQVVERSVARARRMSDARARWQHRLRWT